MYDECSLGEADGWEELDACLEDYDQNWSILRDCDEAWREVILANKPHLFSLGHDQEEVSVCGSTDCSHPSSVFKIVSSAVVPFLS